MPRNLQKNLPLDGEKTNSAKSEGILSKTYSYLIVKWLLSTTVWSQPAQKWSSLLMTSMLNMHCLIKSHGTTLLQKKLTQEWTYGRKQNPSLLDTAAHQSKLHHKTKPCKNLLQGLDCAAMQRRALNWEIAPPGDSCAKGRRKQVNLVIQGMEESRNKHWLFKWAGNQGGNEGYMMELQELHRWDRQMERSTWAPSLVNMGISHCSHHLEIPAWQRVVWTQQWQLQRMSHTSVSLLMN